MKFSLTKNWLSVAAVLGASLAATSAHAASFTYEFFLTPVVGTVGGTVLVTFDEAIPASGNFDANVTDSDTATTTKITKLVATLSDGLVFTLANDGNQADIGFSNGVANNFSYYANSSNPQLALQGVGATNTSGYQFTSDGNFSGPTYSRGTLTFGGLAPTSVTPEPSSFILLGTAALGMVGAARRKFAL